ncbi:AAA family ATPase [Paenibacillus sp. Marseille-Q7038]
MGVDTKNINGVNLEKFPKWLSNIIKKIDVFYIDAERLINNNNIRKVSEYKERLQKIITEYESQYAVRSKELDATFPRRIINIGKNPHNTAKVEKSDIVQSLFDLSIKRNSISKRGVLTEKSAEQILGVDEFKVDDIMDSEILKQFLSVYIEDNFNKFKVLDELLHKINVFETVINDFFADKRLEIHRSTGYTIVSEVGKLRGEEVPPSTLSSREQHFLVLFFELIFNSNSKQLVLIDEPEISLHISWQISMVDKLIEISKLNDIRFILATHSPSIIRNHRDCVIPMGYEED